MRLSGLKITASTVERYIVNDGDYCPIPAGFSEDDCTFLISGVAGNTGWRRDVSKGEIGSISNLFLEMSYNYETQKRDQPKESHHVTTVIGLSGRKVIAVKGNTTYDSYTKGDTQDIYSATRYRVYVLALAFKK